MEKVVSIINVEIFIFKVILFFKIKFSKEIFYGINIFRVVGRNV